MRPDVISFEDWASHLAESGHSPEYLKLREVIIEMKQKHPDVKELARRMFGTYNQYNQDYDDKVDESGVFTPEGIELVYKEAARREMRERVKKAQEEEKRMNALDLKKKKADKADQETPITDLLLKHGLRQSAKISVLDKGGKSRRYRVDFIRPSHGNQRSEVIRSFDGTSTEIDEFLSNPESRRELDEQLGV